MRSISRGAGLAAVFAMSLVAATLAFAAEDFEGQYRQQHFDPDSLPNYPVFDLRAGGGGYQLTVAETASEPIPEHDAGGFDDEPDSRCVGAALGDVQGEVVATLTLENGSDPNFKEFGGSQPIDDECISDRDREDANARGITQALIDGTYNGYDNKTLGVQAYWTYPDENVGGGVGTTYSTETVIGEQTEPEDERLDGVPGTKVKAQAPKRAKIKPKKKIGAGGKVTAKVKVQKDTSVRSYRYGVNAVIKTGKRDCASRFPNADHFGFMIPGSKARKGKLKLKVATKNARAIPADESTWAYKNEPKRKFPGGLEAAHVPGPDGQYKKWCKGKMRGVVIERELNALTNTVTTTNLNTFTIKVK